MVNKDEYCARVALWKKLGDQSHRASLQTLRDVYKDLYMTVAQVKHAANSVNVIFTTAQAVTS